MLLVAEGEGGMEILSPGAVAGTPVEFEGVKRKKKFEEITIDEFFTVGLKVEKGEVFADGKRLLVGGKPLRLGKIRDGRVR
jgi:hypothetical protein